MWLFGKYKDLSLLFVPVWVIWIGLFFLPESILYADVPLWGWVVFVLCIDVGHVWSTLFRTYLDKEEFANHKKVLIFAPLVAFILLFGIARESITYFWTILAYVAVFHFMKQQYGFLALYTAKAKLKQHHKFFTDKFTIYLSMLYPVVYWHLTQRDFVWFVEGDFFTIPFGLTTSVRIIAELAYWIFLSGWLIEEFLLIRKGVNRLSWGRILWMFSTLINWYLGIVWFNSDVAFTTTNVVAHGIPYFTLIIFYQLKKDRIQLLSTKKLIWVGSSILIGSLLLSFGEEYLWDMLVNRDKQSFFNSFLSYPTEVISNSKFQAFVIVCLSLPQVTHYILDGFIWKMNKSNPHLKNLISSNNNG